SMNLFLFLHTGTLLIPIIHGQMMEYRFINVSMNWTQARQSCRENYTDLVTVQTQQDLQRISVPDLTSPGAWIGLFDDPASWYKVMNTDANSWRWSATGDIGTTGYTSWAATEPLFKNALQVCTTLWNNNWHDEDCSRGYRPVCYTVESSVKNFAVSSTLMSWDKALAYCRQNYHDLAMIETQAENEEVFALASTGSVWIGLYREPWRWSDNSKSSFRNWATSEPNNDLEQEHCVAMGSDLLWKDVNCGLQLPFICY
ncbi:hypothetical protein NL108_009748, partial [Boleophthalmus pectinirostris]